MAAIGIVMKIKTALYLAFILGLLAISCGTDASNNLKSALGPKLTRINIPAREHGYSNLQNTTISSTEKLEKFIKLIRQQPAWNDKAAFIKALTDVDIDFNKETILIYVHTEGSGSVKVSLEDPVWEKDNAFIQVTRTVPEIGTGDMVYYAFAFKVVKSIPEVIFFNNGKRIVIKNDNP
jgi:hypothetical protein